MSDIERLDEGRELDGPDVDTFNEGVEEPDPTEEEATDTPKKGGLGANVADLCI